MRGDIGCNGFRGFRGLKLNNYAALKKVFDKLRKSAKLKSSSGGQAPQQ